jgi:hypothetical protein
MCSRELGAEHLHLVEVTSHKLVCACDPCAILFEGQHSGHYKRVPRSALYLQDFQMSDGQWESLMVPIEMAFFFKSGPLQRIVALYPSPAGAVESQLPLSTWDEIAAANPRVREMEADVVALLVNRFGIVRLGAGRTADDHEERSAEYYLAPIDKCYQLVGIIRAKWRGLSGGREVWSEIDQFFAELKKQSTIVNASGGAVNA